jgi:hypothetical protein
MQDVVLGCSRDAWGCSLDARGCSLASAPARLLRAGVYRGASHTQLRLRSMQPAVRQRRLHAAPHRALRSALRSGLRRGLVSGSRLPPLVVRRR